MTPSYFANRIFPTRRAFCFLVLPILCGCHSAFTRSEQNTELEDLVQEEAGSILVGDIASSFGMNHIKIEGIGLATRLKGTGGSPPNSAQREKLLAEMQSHNVDQPNRLLASPDTSLVLLQGFLPPGAQKGDRFNVKVQVPRNSETTSLEGAWLMQARIFEVAILGNSLHTGHLSGLAEGSVLLAAASKGRDDKVNLTRGHILGGGVVKNTRKMGLMVREDHKTVAASRLIASAINARFHTFSHGVKSDVSRPINDKRIELALPYRYKNNRMRFIRVVQSIAVSETPPQRVERIQLLEQKLLEPTSSVLAALQLEAIGKDGIDSLKKGLDSENLEVRFYSAEALAYMDVAEAAAVLADLASREQAFRWHALTALTAMDQIEAFETLNQMLHDSSAETRYGAFRAIRTRNPHDHITQGERLGEGAGAFNYHVISSKGDPMIHISLANRLELVLFGAEEEMKPPEYLFAGKNVMLQAEGDSRLKVSRFKAGEEDKIAICSTRLDDVVRAIVEVGGGYADIVAAIQKAKQQGNIESRVVVDALARPGRTYHRNSQAAKESLAVGRESSRIRVASPFPDLFSGQSDQREPEEKEPLMDADIGSDFQPRLKPRKSFFGKMTSWFTDES